MIKFNDLFLYDNGNLIWKIKPSKRYKAGMIAGTIDGEGYVSIGYKRKLYLAHRIIWEMHFGRIPEGMEVDHINHNRSDNRIENLRLVSRSNNQKNMSMFKSNSSGVTGVWYSKNGRGRWVAEIKSNGKKFHLGRFKNFEDAVAARKAAEIELNFHKNHGV